MTIPMTTKKVRAWVYRKYGSNDYHLAIDWPWWNDKDENDKFEPFEIELTQLQKKVRGK